MFIDGLKTEDDVNKKKGGSYFLKHVEFSYSVRIVWLFITLQVTSFP